jgi:hypothetical protein
MQRQQELAGHGRPAQRSAARRAPDALEHVGLHGLGLQHVALYACLGGMHFVDALLKGDDGPLDCKQSLHHILEVDAGDHLRGRSCGRRGSCRQASGGISTSDIAFA